MPRGSRRRSPPRERGAATAPPAARSRSRDRDRDRGRRSSRRSRSDRDRDRARSHETFPSLLLRPRPRLRLSVRLVRLVRLIRLVLLCCCRTCQRRGNPFDAAVVSKTVTAGSAAAPKSKGVARSYQGEKERSPQGSPRKQLGRVGLASAPELIIDRGAKDFSDAAKEAAQQRRANTSLDINKVAARKRVLNPCLSHRVDEDVRVFIFLIVLGWEPPS